MIVLQARALILSGTSEMQRCAMRSLAANQPGFGSFCAAQYHVRHFCPVLIFDQGKQRIGRMNATSLAKAVWDALTAPSQSVWVDRAEQYRIRAASIIHFALAIWLIISVFQYWPRDQPTF